MLLVKLDDSIHFTNGHLNKDVSLISEDQINSFVWRIIDEDDLPEEFIPDHIQLNT